VGFPAVNPFIGLAKRANVRFDAFHEVEHDPLLMVAGMETNRTVFTYLGQGLIE
jgi:hypothetical protein